MENEIDELTANLFEVGWIDDVVIFYCVSLPLYKDAISKEINVIKWIRLFPSAIRHDVWLVADVFPITSMQS